MVTLTASFLVRTMREAQYVVEEEEVISGQSPRSERPALIRLWKKEALRKVL